MVRPWVKVSLCQYQKLKEIGKKNGRPLSEIIREAVSGFVHKKKYPANAIVPHPPKGTRDKYKSVSAYFPRSDWNLLEGISRNTGRCKTELIREAVDDYLERRA